MKIIKMLNDQMVAKEQGRFDCERCFLGPTRNIDLLAELVSRHPEHRDYCYDTVMTDEEFDRFVYGSLYQLVKLVSIFPEYSNELYEKVTTDKNLERFVLFHGEKLAELLGIFPEYQDDLYKKMCTTTERFNRITYGSVDALGRLVNVFQAHKSDFYEKVNTVENLKRFTFGCAEQLDKLICIFPEHKDELSLYALSKGIDLSKVVQPKPKVELDPASKLEQMESSGSEQPEHLELPDRFSLFYKQRMHSKLSSPKNSEGMLNFRNAH